MSTTFERIADELLDTIERQRAELAALTAELKTVKEEQNIFGQRGRDAEELLQSLDGWMASAGYGKDHPWRSAIRTKFPRKGEGVRSRPMYDPPTVKDE